MFPENNLSQELPASYYPVSFGFLSTLDGEIIAVMLFYVTIKGDSLVKKEYWLPQFGFILQMVLSATIELNGLEFLIPLLINSELPFIKNLKKSFHIALLWATSINVKLN